MRRPSWRSVKEFLLAAPPKDHAETLPERRQRWYENLLAIIMAVAAIAATWASFEASQWGGKASGLVSEAEVIRADSTRWAARGVEQTLVDGAVWLEWEKAVQIGRDDYAEFLRGRFSFALDQAQQDWVGNAVLDETGAPVSGRLPRGTPMGLDSYVPPAQEMSELHAAQSEELRAESRIYSEISDRYVLMTILFALVLFFGSVATKFGNPKVQLALGGLAAFLLVSAVVRMALLPIA